MPKLSNYLTHIFFFSLLGSAFGFLDGASTRTKLPSRRRTNVCIYSTSYAAAYASYTTRSSHTASPAATQEKKVNPKYPNLSFEKYLANPYFAKIETTYPGLQLVHEDPFIFIVNDFLTADECARLREKASTSCHLRPQVGGGPVERTSRGVVCVNEEVPMIRSKFLQLLTTCVTSPDQLQPLKVSRYQEGQTFSKHTDAWPTEGAPVSRGWVHERDFFGDHQRPTVGCHPAKNQPNQNTLLTTFCYLNTIHGSGYTTFPNIGLHKSQDSDGNMCSFYDHPKPMDSHQRPDGSAWDWEYRDADEPLRVEPEQGMAVLHFCSTVPEHGGMCDGNVMHVAEKPDPGMEKFVCQQFVASCTEWVLPDDSLPYGRVSWDTI